MYLKPAAVTQWRLLLLLTDFGTGAERERDRRVKSLSVSQSVARPSVAGCKLAAANREKN